MPEQTETPVSLDMDNVNGLYKQKIEPLTQIDLRALPPETKELFMRVEISEKMVALVQAAGGNKTALLLQGIPALINSLGAEFVLNRWDDFLDMGIWSGETVYDLFKSGFPAMEQSVGMALLNAWWDDFAAMGKNSGSLSWVLCQHVIPSWKEKFGEEYLKVNLSKLAAPGAVTIENISRIEDEGIAAFEDVDEAIDVEDVLVNETDKNESGQTVSNTVLTSGEDDKDEVPEENIENEKSKIENNNLSAVTEQEMPVDADFAAPLPAQQSSDKSAPDAHLTQLPDGAVEDALDSIDIDEPEETFESQPPPALQIDAQSEDDAETESISESFSLPDDLQLSIAKQEEIKEKTQSIIDEHASSMDFEAGGATQFQTVSKPSPDGISDFSFFEQESAQKKSKTGNRLLKRANKTAKKETNPVQKQKTPDFDSQKGMKFQRPNAHKILNSIHENIAKTENLKDKLTPDRVVNNHGAQHKNDNADDVGNLKKQLAGAVSLKDAMRDDLIGIKKTLKNAFQAKKELDAKVVMLKEKVKDAGGVADDIENVDVKGSDQAVDLISDALNAKPQTANNDIINGLIKERDALKEMVLNLQEKTDGVDRVEKAFVEMKKMKSKSDSDLNNILKQLNKLLLDRGALDAEAVSGQTSQKLQSAVDEVLRLRNELAAAQSQNRKLVKELDAVNKNFSALKQRIVAMGGMFAKGAQ